LGATGCGAVTGKSHSPQWARLTQTELPTGKFDRLYAMHNYTCNSSPRPKIWTVLTC